MYPVSFRAEFVEERSRLSNFFRYFLLIPLMIVAFFYAIAVYAVVIVAWFALLFTGRYPQGMYEFNGRMVRFFSRFSAYANLMTDRYPSFNGDEDPAYPVHVAYGAPLEQYSNVMVLFRMILAIRVWIMLYLYGMMQGIVTFCSWFVIVFTGKQPVGLQNLLNLAAAYHTRAWAYVLLMTEPYPPITEQSQLEASPASPQLG